MTQRAPKSGLGIDYDPQTRQLTLVAHLDGAPPRVISYPREDAVRLVQAILDAMGIGSNLVELDPPENPPH